MIERDIIGGGGGVCVNAFRNKETLNVIIPNWRGSLLERHVRGCRIRFLERARNGRRRDSTISPTSVSGLLISP